MTSEKQVAANRRNAVKSTGPRTVHGKARSKMNALRHGFAGVEFSAAIAGEPELTGTIHASSKLLRRIRQERNRLLDDLSNLATANDVSKRDVILKQIAALERYEGQAYAVQKRSKY